MRIIATIATSLRARMRSERGQDLLEYALLGGLIAAALMVVVGGAIMTGALSTMATNISYCIDFASSTACGPF